MKGEVINADEMHFVTWARWKERKKQQPLNVEKSIICCVPYHLFNRMHSLHIQRIQHIYRVIRMQHISSKRWMNYFIGRLFSLTQIEFSLFTYSRYACNMHKFHTWTKDNILEMICSLSGYWYYDWVFFCHEKIRPITFRMFTVIHTKMFR